MFRSLFRRTGVPGEIGAIFRRRSRDIHETTMQGRVGNRSSLNFHYQHLSALINILTGTFSARPMAKQENEANNVFGRDRNEMFSLEKYVTSMRSGGGRVPTDALLSSRVKVKGVLKNFACREPRMNEKFFVFSFRFPRAGAGLYLVRGNTVESFEGCSGELIASHSYGVRESSRKPDTLKERVRASRRLSLEKCATFPSIRRRVALRPGFLLRFNAKGYTGSGEKTYAHANTAVCPH